MCRKSTTGAIHLISGTPVDWTSARQGLVALSTCEAEYIAATTAVQSTSLIRCLLEFVQLLPRNATSFLIDNTATISVADNTASTRKRKFIDLRFHYLRHHHEAKHINLGHVPSASNIAEVLTKPLGHIQFAQLRKHMRVLCPKDRKALSFP